VADKGEKSNMRDITLEELLEAGCHFGHQKRRWNPAMKKYIYGERDGVHIFDLAKTKVGLEKAGEFLAGVAKNDGEILLVGTKRQAAEFIKTEALRTNMPYVSVRWMGGLLTNYANLSQRIKKLADMKAKREAGEYKKFTKLEQLQLDREIQKLEKFFGGVAKMRGLPQAMFVVDVHKEEVAVKEAYKMGIPVVGIVDTNSDPKMVQYVIPANDDAVKSIELIIKAVGEAIKPAMSNEQSAKSKEPMEKNEVKVNPPALKQRRAKKVNKVD
jgi:small subunit ribosomal protein S2